MVFNQKWSIETDTTDTDSGNDSTDSEDEEEWNENSENGTQGNGTKRKATNSCTEDDQPTAKKALTKGEKRKNMEESEDQPKSKIHLSTEDLKTRLPARSSIRRWMDSGAILNLRYVASRIMESDGVVTVRI